MDDQQIDQTDEPERRRVHLGGDPSPTLGYDHLAPPPAPAGFQGQQGTVVAAKNPALAAILSFFIPGLGSMLNGSVTMGAILLGAYLTCWAISALLWFVLLGWLMWPFLIGLVVWAMVDAYRGAQRWNARHGIIS